jgi:putative FmdB family regulatory protein
VPLFEYSCPQCGRFEILHKFADQPLTQCPTCAQEVQRLASAPAIQFKGSGWYVTDYARKGGSSGEGKSNGEKATSKATTTPDAGSSTPSSSTPAKSDGSTK